MSDWTETLTQAVQAASTPGAEFVLQHLLARTALETDPITALADHDLGNEIFAATDDELGFVNFARRAQRPLVEPNVTRLVEAIRWFKYEIGDWSEAKDPTRSRLAAIFVVATMLDEDGLLWTLLPNELGANDALNQALVTFLSHSRITLSLRPTRSPINDQDSLDRFLHAEQNKDWAALRWQTERASFGFYASVVLTQSVRFLNRFKPDLLRSAVRGVAQVSLAMQIVCAISRKDAFVLAKEETNDYLRFASVSRLFDSRPPVRQMTTDEEDALARLLENIAKDPQQWPAWMQAFNAHPAQSGVIQNALGRCLVTADDMALDAYMRSIVLHTGEAGREAITTCLSVFAAAAPVDKRQRAWQMAYSQWSDWNFGEKDGHTKLTTIVVSPIDFAILGYAVECLDSAQRDEIIAKDLARIGEVEDHWQQSAVDCVAEVFSALSHLQPFAHAQVCAAGPDTWLMAPNHLHVPEALRDNLYFRLRYHMDNLRLQSPQASP